MIEEFEKWTLTRPVLPFGVSVNFFRNYGDSALLDVGSELRLGRITVWNTGAVELEINDASSGKQLFFHSQRYRTWQDVFPEVRTFLNALKSS